MSGENVTIFTLSTTVTNPVANDRYVMWQTTASQTVQVTASQAAEGAGAIPVTWTSQTTATSCATGAVSFFASSPAGFVTISLNGTAVKLPYYNT